MNGVDIFFAIVILFVIIMGWKNGFIPGSLNLLSRTGSLVAAYFFISTPPACRTSILRTMPLK